MKRKKTKDYQKKNLKNPHFPNKKKEGGRGLLKFKFLIFGLGLFIFSIFLLTSDYFSIRTIDITDNERVDSAEIRGVIQEVMDKRRFFVLKQNNLFLFDKKSAIEKLSGNYLFEDIQIKKKLFGTIEVVVSEKNNGVIWSTANEQYYLDLKGVVIRQLAETDLVIERVDDATDVVRSEVSSSKYPLIYDQSDATVKLGDIVTSSELVEFVISLQNELDLGSDFEVSHYVIIRPFFPEITLITKEGWEARFKLGDDAVKQARVLNSLLQQKIRDRSNLNYIDLRFGEKVFYK